MTTTLPPLHSDSTDWIAPLGNVLNTLTYAAQDIEVTYPGADLHYLYSGIEELARAIDTLRSAQTTVTTVPRSAAPVSNRFITIYTDGACEGNPGRGGWGAVIDDSAADVVAELSGHESQTTNNRMEMMAAIAALSHIPSESGTRITLYTDSQYLQKGITQWVKGWQKGGWKTSNKKPVKNKDLWLRLVELDQIHSITWKWIKGHNGDPGNERADQLATTAVRS